MPAVPRVPLIQGVYRGEYHFTQQLKLLLLLLLHLLLLLPF